MAFPSEEPTAENRAMASTVRGMFVALVNEGFTEAQAIRIVSNMLQSAIQAGMRKDD